MILFWHGDWRIPPRLLDPTSSLNVKWHLQVPPLLVLVDIRSWTQMLHPQSCLPMANRPRHLRLDPEHVQTARQLRMAMRLTVRRRPRARMREQSKCWIACNRNLLAVTSRIMRSWMSSIRLTSWLWKQRNSKTCANTTSAGVVSGKHVSDFKSWQSRCLFVLTNLFYHLPCVACHCCALFSSLLVYWQSIMAGVCWMYN